MRTGTLLCVGLAALFIAPVAHGEERPLREASTLTASETPLLDLSYHLRANVKYTTGLYAVPAAPRPTHKVKVYQAGSAYCDILIDKVEYTTVNPGYRKSAAPVGTDATYEIPDGVVYGLSVDFHQVYWDGVDCSVKIYDAGGGTNPTPNEQLIGAISFGGGFQQNATLDFPSTWPVESIRFAVPSFCANVEVLEAGTVVGGVFYKATTTDHKTFIVDSLGSSPVTQIRAALNGPSASTCSIPVYAVPAPQ